MVRDYRLYKYQKKNKNYQKMVSVKRRQLPSFRNQKLVYLLATALVFIGYLVLFYRGNPGITVARYGRLSDEFTSKGLLVKYEDVVLAPYAGKVKLLSADGERYPAGQPILEMTSKNGKKIFYSAKPGVLSFEVDGLESTLKPTIFDELTQDYREFRGKAFRIANGEKVNAGRPLFKIVNNFTLFMLVEASPEEYIRYQVGEKIWATFDNLTVVGWVKRKLDNQRLFVIQLERFPGEVATKRWVNVTIMTNAYSGVIIPRSALAQKDKSTGVYKMTEGNLYFQAVTVNGGTVNEVVVTGIDRGTEILANPEKNLTKYIKRDRAVVQEKKETTPVKTPEVKKKGS